MYRTKSQFTNAVRDDPIIEKNVTFEVVSSAVWVTFLQFRNLKRKVRFPSKHIAVTAATCLYETYLFRSIMTEVLSAMEPETALYDLQEDINSQTPIQNR